MVNKLEFLIQQREITESERKEASAIADRIVNEVTRGYVPDMSKYIPFKQDIGLDNDRYGQWG